MTHERNRDGIQFAELRALIDPKVEGLHDGLEEAYYGDRDPVTGALDRTTGWLAGVSKPWHGFDKQATPALSKSLFERLHGALFDVHYLFFHDENQNRQTPYSRGDYDDYDDDGVPGSRVADSRAALRDFRTNFGAEFGALMAAFNTVGVVVDPDATD